MKHRKINSIDEQDLEGLRKLNDMIEKESLKFKDGFNIEKLRELSNPDVIITTETVLNYLSMNKDYLISKYFIKKIGIAGSFARGDFNEKSDIDFVVFFNSKAKKNRIFRLYINLQDELEAYFHRKVDIIVNGEVLPAFQEKILKETIYV